MNATHPRSSVHRSSSAVLALTLAGLLPATVLQGQTAATPPEEPTVKLDDVESMAEGDPNFILPTQPIEGAIGFAKPLLETPRSATVISSEMISSMSISEVADLSRIAPNTNTTTRWGVQGNIDIRNMTADTYFRGMKRIEPQGNSRTVLGANDQIEVIRGPAPAYFGSGKIGGYTNMTPKSGRSRQGAYLEKDEGFFQFTVGQYGKRELSFGYGGALPTSKEGRRGGYYLYGLLEDSDSYYKNVPVEQRVLQAAVSRELTASWRMETGINYQENHSAGGFLNRLTQEMFDGNIAWGGHALYVMDTDGSGKISEREMILGSPVGGVFGAASTTNRALATRMYGTNAANGVRFTTALAGAVPTLGTTNPNSALAALRTQSPGFVAIMEANPVRYGNNLKLLNVLQRGFVLDPASVKPHQANYEYVALEKELVAKLGLVYFDLVNDKNEDLKFKNQVLFDSQDQFKDSELPFYQKQDVWVVEDKFTVEYRVKPSALPDWLTINTISSANVRYTNAKRRFNTGDYDDRPDLTMPENTRTAFDLFVSPRENSDYFNGGAAFSGDIRSKYTETGVGSMADINVGKHINIIAGGRLDYIQADTKVPSNLYLLGTDGLFSNDATALAASGEGSELGKSYTVSVSYRAPFNLNPYITYGEQTALADSSDLTLAGNIAANGPYDAASIQEAGIKGSHFKGKLYWAASAYRQKRATVTADPAGNPLVGGLGNVKGKGVELEVRFVPTKNFFVSAFTVFQKTEIVGEAGWVRVHGDPLGFTDVVDPTTGAVIYPSEAFTWGGVASILIPADQKTEHPAYPNTSHGLALEYTLPMGLTLGANGNYISAVQSGRYQKFILPEAYTLNLSLSYRIKGWKLKLDGFNVTDELYFRGRNGTTAGDVLISAMPGRRFQTTISKQF